MEPAITSRLEAIAIGSYLSLVAAPYLLACSSFTAYPKKGKPFGKMLGGIWAKTISLQKPEHPLHPLAKQKRTRSKGATINKGHRY